MLAPVTHIIPLTTIHRERLLAAPGHIVVRKGQKVAATDTIAESDLRSDHLILDIARGLGLPPDKAESYIQYKRGERVSEGNVIAGPVGMAKRVVRAPRDGRILQVGEGHVLLELDGSPFELKAGLPGTVIELLGERGVMIETTGALVQGVWGNGRIDSGLLTVTMNAPDDTLTADRLDVSLRGAVILAGYCREAQALQAAADLPVRALIVSNLDPSLVNLAARLKFPLIVLQGFGRHPLNSAAYKLLTTNERREAAVNATPWDRYAGSRPEVVIPLPTSIDLPVAGELAAFTPGQTVRSVRAPFAGQIGVLTNLKPGQTVLPSGLSAPAAEVRLENGKTVVFPLSNLEVLA